MNTIWDRLFAIRKRVQKATRGPWVTARPNIDEDHMCTIMGPVEDGCRRVIGKTWDPDHLVSYVGFTREDCINNAMLMANARTDLPFLLEIANTAFEALSRIHNEVINEPSSKKIARDALTTITMKGRGEYNG